MLNPLASQLTLARFTRPTQSSRLQKYSPGESGTKATTLRQQLVRSHLRVAALAALVLLVAAVAMQMLREPISTIRTVNVPSANAAMLVQLGLQRSEANLRGWVALANPEWRNNVETAWSDEIRPAFESLRELSSRHDTAARQTALSSLEEKLAELKKLQDWTIEVAAKAGNEPARLVFSQEFGPAREQLVMALSTFRQQQPDALPVETFFQLRLALSEAEAALGRFVVEGYENDASSYRRYIDRVRALLIPLEAASGQIPDQLNTLERLSESVIESRRSPRSNVAWHTISTRVAPLSADIASELAVIAEFEVSAMRSRVEQIAVWTRILSIFSVLALAVVVIFALFFSNTEARRISAPVTKLYRATEALKNGNYEKALKPEGVCEVQGLISAFNAMRESISTSHQALEKIAYSDDLTGLANRKDFNDTIAAMNSESLHDSNVAGVLIIDLDYFKRVNDSLGHDAGDRLLEVFGCRLRECLGPTDYAARIGGDEFAVLLGSLQTAKDVKPVIEKIRKTISQPINYQGDTITPSATIGAAVDSLANIAATELVKQADLALYDAKEKGRGGYCFYSLGLHKKSTQFRRLAELIDLNTPEVMFTLVYQPYVDMSSGNIVGVEALLRCNHPECEQIQTIDIITMLERNGYIARISQWVMKEALNQHAQWSNTFHLPPDFTMSVNVSAALLRDAGFVQSILDIVDNSGVPANSLLIEITETTVMEDYTRSNEAMRKLNSAGIEFAMDDFGTGYSSLERLREMPLSLLKVDQTFVKGMLSSANDAAIVDASVRLGHAIGVSVTAEGIESQAHAEALQALGCDRGQGYYYSRPQAPEELNLLKKLRQRAA